MHDYKGGNNGGLIHGNRVQSVLKKQPDTAPGDKTAWQKFEDHRAILVPKLEQQIRDMLNSGCASSHVRVVAFKEALQNLVDAHFPGKPPPSHAGRPVIFSQPHLGLKSGA